MGTLHFNFKALLLRLRYTGSTIEEVTDALGIDVPSRFSFVRFLDSISEGPPRSQNLKRFMPRHKAEAEFSKAVAKDSFRNDTFFSFDFSSGCLEVHLCYDRQSRLRRAYLIHRLVNEPLEIHLSRS